MLTPDVVKLRQRVIDLRRKGWTVPGIVAQTAAPQAWVQSVCDEVDGKKYGGRRAVFATVDRPAARRA